ncbi:MAG: hypothetical protein K6T65_04895 [Peptococcaceae bacterium]|nr:hypothetical protein [Peptococcaceae bacterium]
MIYKKENLFKWLSLLCVLALFLFTAGAVSTPSFAQPTVGDNSRQPPADQQRQSPGGQEQEDMQNLMPKKAPGTITSNKTEYNEFHETIYINGTNMAHRRYKVHFFDGMHNKVGTSVVRTDKDGNFRKPAVYTIQGTEAPGLWHADAVNNFDIEATCTFTVLESAIPEFSSGLAAVVVAGLCAFIYQRMRKRREVLG